MNRLYVIDLGESWEDTTVRARRLLREAALVLVRGAALAGLASSEGCHVPLLRLDRSGPDEALWATLRALGAGDAAWASPGIAQWGAADQALLCALLDRGIEVLSVPGGSDVISALVLSGLPNHRFSYLGEMSSDRSVRRLQLERVARDAATLGWHVKGTVLVAVLRDVQRTLGERFVTLYGERQTWRGQVRDAPVWLEDVVLIVAGAAEDHAWTESSVRAEVRALLEGGVSARDIAREVAERSGWGKKAVYRIALDAGTSRRD